MLQPTYKLLPNIFGMTLIYIAIKHIPNMHRHALVTGLAATGKSTLARYFIKRGKKAIDADYVIAKWVDESGHTKKYEKDIGKEFLEKYKFQWDIDKLQKLLNKNEELYVFGASTNLYDLADYFDERYYLKADENLLATRLKTRTGPYDFGRTEEQKHLIFSWIEYNERKAKENGFVFVDASLSPARIFSIICKTDSSR